MSAILVFDVSTATFLVLATMLASFGATRRVARFAAMDVGLVGATGMAALSTLAYAFIHGRTTMLQVYTGGLMTYAISD